MVLGKRSSLIYNIPTPQLHKLLKQETYFYFHALYSIIYVVSDVDSYIYFHAINCK